MSETAAQKQVRAHGGCGELLNDGRDICILQAGHGAHAEPSDRDKIIAKVAEAMAIEVNRQRDTGELRVDTSGRRSLARRDAGVTINLAALATAAFDALVEAWSPPF